MNGLLYCGLSSYYGSMIGVIRMVSKADFIIFIVYLFIFCLLMFELLLFGLIMTIPHDQLSDEFIINVVDGIIDWVVR